jgi:hypothetical protein
LQKDFVSRASISTRFSTELLKTFAQNLYFLKRWAAERFQKCLAAFSPFFFGNEPRPWTKKKFSRAARQLAACMCLCTLAIRRRAAAKYPGPK